MGHSKSDSLQLGWYSRPGVIYAPRRILFTVDEARPQDDLYLMYVGEGAEGPRGPIPFDPWLPRGYRIGQKVYANPAGRFYPSRTPSGGGNLADVAVYKLVAAAAD